MYNDVITMPDITQTLYMSFAWYIDHRPTNYEELDSLQLHFTVGFSVEWQ